MTVLIERLEAASEGSRELDLDIAISVDPGYAGMDAGHRAFLIKFGGHPAFTTSLDAAMTLAEGCGGQLTFFKDGTAKAFLWQPYPLAVEANGATRELAICIAALKARGTS